jgi:beta-N-acetylhexosaminidase
VTRRFGAALLGCAGLSLTREEAAFFGAFQPFGFILFARNVSTAEQLRALTTDLRAAVGWDAPVFIDQEGGRVQRIRPPLARNWMPPLDEADRFQAQAPAAFALRARIIAHEMATFGIDGICAPLIDVAHDNTHPVLRNRCYGRDPDTVLTIAQAVAEGTLAGGALPVVKHLPGHGRAQLDSHLALPRTDVSLTKLESVDFVPVRGLGALPLAMTAHVVYATLDDKPATQSPQVVMRMRRDLGVSGFLMTDDVSMNALSGTVPERGAAALAAGCDAVLHCNGDLDEMQALADRIGPLSDAAQVRADAALAARPGRDLVPTADLVAAYKNMESRL